MLYVSTFGFFFLLAFTFLNMQFLQWIPPSYSRSAVVAFSLYSLALLLFLLLFAAFLSQLLSSPTLLPRKVRDDDRVLLDSRLPRTATPTPSPLSTLAILTSPPLLRALTALGSAYFLYDTLQWVAAYPSPLHLFPLVAVTASLVGCGSAPTRLVLLGLYAAVRVLSGVWMVGGWVSPVVLWGVLEWSLGPSSTARSTVATTAVLFSHLFYTITSTPAHSLYSCIAVLLWAPLHFHCSRQSLREVEVEEDGESDLSPEVQRVKWLTLSLAAVLCAPAGVVVTERRSAGMGCVGSGGVRRDGVVVVEGVRL